MNQPLPRRRLHRPEAAASGTFRRAQPSPPQAGVDYPRSNAEFRHLYPDDAACRVTLERLRWPQGFGCRRCGSREQPFRSGLLMGCASCGYLASITCDTLFHGTAKPLRLWFRALWEVVGQPQSIGPRRMQRLLDLRDVRSGREMVTRVRRAMAAAVSDPLRGVVEVARTYVDVPRCDGRPLPGSPGRGEGGRRTAEMEPLVVIVAAERTATELGRARFGVLARPDAAAVDDFVANAVEPGSTVHTGSWSGYRSLECAGFEHVAPDPHRGASPLELAHAAEVGEALRRWLWSSRSVTRSELPAAVDEFAFRYRYRACQRGLSFYQLLRQAAPVERVPPPAPRRSARPRLGSG